MSLRSQHQSRSPPGVSKLKRAQNVAAKAASQRLAQVMASQNAHVEENEEEYHNTGYPYAPPSPLAYPRNNGANNNRFHSSLVRESVDPSPSILSNTVGRPSISVHRTPLLPHIRSSPRPTISIPPIDPPSSRQQEKRFQPEMGLNINNSGSQHEAAALEDELDMLQEENENFLYKLRLAEERCEEAEARATELEKQVAALGDGLSLEAKLLSRKEAALRQREVALKAAQRTSEGRDEEIVALQSEVLSVQAGTAGTIEKLREVESEVESLRSVTQRMILTQEEMEEVVLKRCWLARYWGLALQHGIRKNIAVRKYEHWSSLAPLPFEVVISAGQKAKRESQNQCDDDPVERSKLTHDFSGLTGEGYIESRLSVEMGLRELASLKVEDAVMLALAQNRHTNLLRQSVSDSKAAGGLKYMEAFELHQDELDDILFKEAWLTYFWKRAETHGLEEDIAEERLQYWSSRSGQSPTSHDIINVERGMTELRKLGIEQQLWEISRREFDQNGF